MDILLQKLVIFVSLCRYLWYRDQDICMYYNIDILKFLKVKLGLEKTLKYRFRLMPNRNKYRPTLLLL